MAAYGFPSRLQYGQLTTIAADLKARAQNARTEMVTGRIADLKTELGSQIGETHLLKKAIDEVSARKETAARALGRAEASQLALARSTEGSETLGADLLSAVGQGNEPSIAISATRADRQLEAAISAFNTRYEGRSLFAGDATDLPALADADVLLDDIRTIFAGAADNAQLQADLDAYFNDPLGGFETNIYLGGDGEAARTEIADGEVVSYSAKADEQPVRDLLRNLSVIVVASENSGFAERAEALNSAASGLMQSTTDIVSVRSRIGVSEERIKAADERLAAEATALTLTYSEQTARDPLDAAAYLQQIESQLEASYIVTSRIALLSLVNYLR